MRTPSAVPTFPWIRHLTRLLQVIIVAAIAAGCAGPHYRLSPEAPAKVRHISTVAIPPPEVKMHEVSTGGMIEQRIDWSKQAAEALRKAVEARLAGAGLKPVPPAQREPVTAELREVFDLFGVVGGAVVAHTYNQETLFPEKTTRFVYSVGPLANVLTTPPADALVLVQGAGSVTTGGRVTLAVIGALMGMAVPTGGTLLQAALVDHDGTLLWYNFMVSPFASDLREPDKAAGAVESLFDGFPAVRP